VSRGGPVCPVSVKFPGENSGPINGAVPPNPQTPHPQHSTLNTQHSTLNPQPSTLN
ncbi:hypothetical protein T484DRAFT_1919687, partial [Baffinella frigidus]